MKTIKLPKALANRINEVNELIRTANDECLLVTTYDGGTFPYIIDLKPISVNGKFVTIESVKPNQYSYVTKERFCITKTDMFDDNGLFTLNYTLKVIRRALLSAIKQELN
jgi:hypothetical protein